MGKIVDFVKGNNCIVVVGVTFLIILGLLFYTNRISNDTKKYIEEIEYLDSLESYHKIYYEKTFSHLRKENKQLYDSLRSQKDRIDFLVEFTHEKEYNSGKVIVKHDTVYKDLGLEPKTFTYKGEKNDTIDYTLTINSLVEPNWYQFQAKVKNKFTIVDKNQDGDDVSIITIKPNNGGNVSNVTVFNKKEKRKLKDRFAVGPTANVGYDVLHNDLSITVGIGIAFDLK